MIGSIAFHAAPTKIANVHRHANDCIAVPPGWVPAIRVQAWCHGSGFAPRESCPALRLQRRRQLFRTGDCRNLAVTERANVPESDIKNLCSRSLTHLASLGPSVKCVEPGRDE